MREILFKAKRIDNGEWIYGNLLQTDDGICIIQNYVPHHYHLLNQCEINPETICQYTGLTDKKGKKIWENDILEIRSGYYGTWKSFVKYEKGSFVVKSKYGDIHHLCESEIVDDGRAKFRTTCVYEVIGNVFDNTELLESEE